MSYRDLRGHIDKLEKAGELQRRWSLIQRNG